jgi:hypothetical protein
MADTTAVLNRRQFEQALLVLDRERLSPSDEARFDALTIAVWVALGLTTAWAAAFFPLHSLAYYLIRAAASAYVVAIALFFANLNLVAKIWRDVLARRRSRLLPNLKAFVRVRHRQHLVAYLMSYALAAFGAVLCLIGAYVAVYDWPVWRSDDKLGATLVGGPTAFGLACILMWFVVQWRDRIAGIADLRASLMRGEDADKGGTTVPTPVYEEITGIDREQINQDRRRNVAAGRSAMPSAAYAVRVSRDIYARVPELMPDEWVAISRRIQELQSTVDMPRDADTAAAGISFLPVPPTAWEIGFRVDNGSRELQLIALRRGA